MIEKIDATTEESVDEPVETGTALQRRLDPKLKMAVLAMIARGEKYGTIVRILKEDYKIDYSKSSVAALKRDNKDVVVQMQSMILEAEASQADQIRVQALRQLNRKLGKAADDEQELESLDEEYRTTEMTLSEYRRKKAGLLKMTVSDLVLISKEMHSQSGKAKAPLTPGLAGSGETDDSTNGADPKFVEALMGAIQRGDTVSLMKIEPTNVNA